MGRGLLLATLITFFLVVLTNEGLTQIKFNVKVSDRHLQKVEKSKDARKKLKSYKKFYKKDSLKNAKKAWKEYAKTNKDSLKAVGDWKEAKANQKEVLTGEWEKRKKGITEYEMDSLSFPDPKDSLDYALRELAIQKEFDRIQELYKEYAHYDSSYLERFHKDSIKLDSAELARRFEMKERLESYMPEELAQQTDQDITQQFKYGELDQFGNLQKVDRSGVKEFFQKVPPEQFSKSQLSMMTLKKKYAVLPDLEKQEEGIKRQSLEGSPWKKRIFLGGHVTIQSTHPIILDSDIRIGYRFNKKLSSGIGFILREQFNQRSSSLTGDAHGYALFTSYDINPTYFVYGEYQAVKNEPFFGESLPLASWEYAYLLGAGRKFQLAKKVTVTLSLLYDFNFKHNDLNARPLVFRVGYVINLK